MALKLPDSAVPMGDFPVAKAVDIDFDDGENLQDKFDNGELGGAGGTATFTSLDALGLTPPVSVGEIFNAMPNNTMAVIACEGKEGNIEGADVHVSDVPISFGVLTIKKNEIGRFSIDYQNSLQGSSCNVKRWIGTLKGLDGTGLYWKQLSAEPTFVALTDIGLTADATFQDVIDELPKGGSAILGVTEFTNYQTIFPYEEGNDQFARVHIVKGAEDGSRMYARWFRKDGVKEAIAIFNINDNKFSGWKILKNQQIYTSLKELGLDTTAKINDIIGAMKDGTIFTYKTDVFDYATEYNNIQYGTVTINKQHASRVQALMTDKDTGNLYVGRISASNQLVGWTKMITEKSDPYACTSYTVLTGTEDLFTLPCGHYVTDKTDTVYNYPITDSSTVTAHIYVLGCLNDPANNKGYRIILYFDNKDRMYRINEWWGSFANGWQKMSRSEYHSISQLNKAKGTSIELVNGEDNTSKIMDALGVGDSFLSLFHNDSSKNRFGISTSIGDKINRLHIEKILDANGSSSYCVATAIMNTGVVLSRTNYGGTLSAWVKTPSETRVATLETQVSELFQSVSDGKTLVANAITGKGVSTATNATFATMATNVGKITNYTASEKQALATAITNKGVSTATDATFATMATNVGKITNYTASEKQALATAITNKGVSTSSTDSFATMATNVGKITNYTASDKQALANAITGKGVSTSSTDSFATMATNIGKISGGYKEETKSLIVTSGTTGTEALPFKFSANVIAVKQIVAPSDSCRIVKQTSKDVLTINGSQIVLYVTGSGTWKVTALIEK